MSAALLPLVSAALTFVTPPLGLAPLTDFTLKTIEGTEGLYSLQALHDGAIRLYVLDASVFLPDYTPIISDEQCVALDVKVPDDALVLVVANPGEGGTTINLMAPIVINAATGVCAQVILEGQGWPLRAELGARPA